jgi:PAS domain S-box-containing protein
LLNYVGTVVDVTERKQAEERIRERERRFRLLADAIPHHVWSYSPDGDLSYWNQQILDYTGLTPDQLQQGGWVIVHPDDLDRVKRAWREACETQTPYELEQRLRGRDGGYRRFLYRAVPMRDDEGRLVAWYSTNTDVEEHRAAEEALRETQTKLAHLTRMMAVGELSASLAHELNQPLAAIVANGAAAMRWLDNNPPCIDEATTALHRLIRDAHRAGDVIRHARALLKKSTTSHIPVDLRETLQEVLVLVQPEMTAHGILTHESHTLDLPRVLGAPVELQQLALNLILNALEAMAAIKDRRRELLIRCEQGRLHGGLGVLVSVQDTGGGVHPDAFDRLFEPLFTTKSGGLGLGLSICRTIVDAHGGILWAENNAGQGATFQFLLPACSM